MNGFLASLGYDAWVLHALMIVPLLGALAVLLASEGQAKWIALWVTLFPDRPGEMAAFGIVQHNFFIFFNAAIGLLFLRRANRELFGSKGSG